MVLRNEDACQLPFRGPLQNGLALAYTDGRTSRSNVTQDSIPGGGHVIPTLQSTLGSHFCLAAIHAVSLSLPAVAFDVVRDGQPVATIVARGPEAAAAAKSKRRVESADQRAAGVLVEWIKKMTDAELPVAESGPAGSPLILVGAAWKRGKNVIAVRVDHSAITDLFLGGILRPVLLIDQGS